MQKSALAPLFDAPESLQRLSATRDIRRHTLLNGLGYRNTQAVCLPPAHRRLHPGVEHIKYAASASSFVTISHRCMGTTKAVGVLLPLSKHCISGTRPSTFLGNVQAGAVGVACSVIKHEPFKFVALPEMYRLGRLEVLAAS